MSYKHGQARTYVVGNRIREVYMPGDGIFRHTVDLFLAFVGTTTLVSIMAASILLSSLEQ